MLNNGEIWVHKYLYYWPPPPSLVSNPARVEIKIIKNSLFWLDYKLILVQIKRVISLNLFDKSNI